MGVYNTYGKVQLKITDGFEFYKVGDKVKIPDGVYLGYEGVIVILKGKFVAVFPILTNKWGGEMKPADLIRDDNPLKQAIDMVKLEKGIRGMFRKIQRRWVK